MSALLHAQGESVLPDAYQRHVQLLRQALQEESVQDWQALEAVFRTAIELCVTGSTNSELLSTRHRLVRPDGACSHGTQVTVSGCCVVAPGRSKAPTDAYILPACTHQYLQGLVWRAKPEFHE